jgi:hypothetical protein
MPTCRLTPLPRIRPGVEIDPESLLAQYRNGVPEQQLLAMPEGPVSAIPREHGMS